MSLLKICQRQILQVGEDVNSNSSYWTKLMVSPLLNRPSILHAYLALSLGDSFYRVELKFPSMLQKREFVESVPNEKEAVAGLERFLLFPLILCVKKPTIIKSIECSKLTMEILDYARFELSHQIPMDTKYCSGCTEESFNSNSVIHIICSQFSQLGQLPLQTVGKKPDLEKRIYSIAAE